jgi:hypothetical protein
MSASESRLLFAAAADVASQSLGQVSSQGFVIIGLSSTRLKSNCRSSGIPLTPLRLSPCLLCQGFILFTERIKLILGQFF